MTIQTFKGEELFDEQQRKDVVLLIENLSVTPENAMELLRVPSYKRDGFLMNIESEMMVTRKK